MVKVSIFHMLVAHSITEHDPAVCLSHRSLSLTLSVFSFYHYCLQTQMIVDFYMWMYVRERTCMFGCTYICVYTEVNLRVIPRVLVTWFFESLMRASSSLIRLVTAINNQFVFSNYGSILSGLWLKTADRIHNLINMSISWINCLRIPRVFWTFNSQTR